jgi:hypothetical protein
MRRGYHEWAWRDVFERALGCPPIYFAARREGTIVGVLPTVLLNSWLFGRALISLPFLNYGGVLADDDVRRGPYSMRPWLPRERAAARTSSCGTSSGTSPTCRVNSTRSR